MTITTWLYSSKTSEPTLAKSEEDGIDLAKRFPYSTEAERRRFLNARDNDHDKASNMMSDYFDWRDKNGLKSNTENYKANIGLSEQSHWESAVSEAAALCGDDPETVVLPRLARFNSHNDPNREMRDKDERRVLQFFPGLCDFKEASEATHVLAIALFLDKLFDRTNMEKITLIIDVRAGQGWANLSPTYLLPFIRKVSNTLEANFPERLAYCLVFPVPYAATVFWKMIRKFLDPDTANKIQLLSGSAGIKSPPPKDIVKFFVDDEVQCLEDNRKSYFKEKK